MSFIGIVSNDKKELELLLEKYWKSNPNDIIFLEKDNIDNMRNIKFETVLVLDNVFELEDNLPMLIKIISNATYLLINTDFKDNLDILGDLSLIVITFGFNSKATITVSSTEDKEEPSVLCLQRTVQGFQGKVIDPQEIKLDGNKECNDVFIVMGIVGLSLIYDTNLHFM